jgi:Bacterial Ig-like domain (group 3)
MSLQRHIPCILFLALAAGLRAQSSTETSASQIVVTSNPEGADSVHIQLQLPASANAGALQVYLNGNGVAERFSEGSCKQGVCKEATFTLVDGLRPEKNVLTVDAGGGVSTRYRFSGESEQPDSTNRHATTSAAARILTSRNARAQSASLAVEDPFLPPTVAFNTTHPGGWDGSLNDPWFSIGGQGYPDKQPIGNCSSAQYTVVVLDRQSLEEKTNAPESSPQCVADTAALNAYLKTLDSTDLVIAGSNWYRNADASLDTTPIGGTAYSTKAVSSPLAGYMTIGVGGAAPGTAYESRYFNFPNLPSFNPFATGTLQEDAYGNYDFQSSDISEFTVSPNDPAYLTSSNTSAIAIQNYEGSSTKNFIYTPPAASDGATTDGYWLLVLRRTDLASDGTPCPWGGKSKDGTGQYVMNCGTFYHTGSTNPTVANAAYQALAQALSAINQFQLFVLTTAGQPAQGGTVYDVAEHDSSSTGYLAFFSALQALGGTPGYTTSMFAPGSAYTFVGSTDTGNPLTGSSVESTTALATQLQTGMIHGMFQRNLAGLFTPEQTNQEIMALYQTKGGLSTPDFKLTEASMSQPVDWPSTSQKTLLTSGPFTASSIAGQIAAYRYLSYVLLTKIYMPGSTGSHLDDLHYFFTGSNNTFINFQAYDPSQILWPDYSASGPYVVPCNSIQGSTCTSYILGENDPLVFTENDFLAERGQIALEVRYLTYVLHYLVTGSTNLKDIIAGGNSNVGLALTGAAATILGSKLVPAPPTTTVTTSWQNIVSMLGGVASIVSAVPGVGEFVFGVEAGSAIATRLAKVGTTASIIGGAAGVASGAGQITSSSTSNSLPSSFSKFSMTIGELASGSLQGQLSVGFDVMTDSITSDWGRLSTIGPEVVDSNNSTFFTPDQASQNLSVQGITQAASRNFYMTLLPIFYKVHYWPGVAGYTDLTKNIPDMGVLHQSAGVAYCNAFYLNPAQNHSSDDLTGLGTAPANTNAWFATPAGGNAPFYDTSSTPIDFYLIAGTVTNAGTNTASIQLIDADLAESLFSGGGLNLPIGEFVMPTGPMASVWVDASIKNPAYHQNYNICPAQQYPYNYEGTTKATPTTTTLLAPGSSLLGQNVTLTATVAAGASPVTAGSVDFTDGGTSVGSSPLDATGTATITLNGLAAGQHPLQALYTVAETYQPSSSPVTQLMVYASAPSLSLTASTDTLQITPGEPSLPVKLQVSSQNGLTGTVKYACVGLPAGMTCQFSPSVSTLTIGDLATTSLVINSTAAAVDPAVSGSKIAAGFLLPFSILGLMGMRKTRKRLCAQCMLALFSMIALASLSGCGGSGAAKSVTPQTSTILVSATTSSGATQSLPLALNIQ